MAKERVSGDDEGERRLSEMKEGETERERAYPRE